MELLYRLLLRLHLSTSHRHMKKEHKDQRAGEERTVHAARSAGQGIYFLANLEICQNCLFLNLTLSNRLNFVIICKNIELRVFLSSIFDRLCSSWQMFTILYQNDVCRCFIMWPLEIILEILSVTVCKPTLEISMKTELRASSPHVSCHS